MCRSQIFSTVLTSAWAFSALAFTRSYVWHLFWSTSWRTVCSDSLLICYADSLTIISPYLLARSKNGRQSICGKEIFLEKLTVYRFRVLARSSKEANCYAANGLCCWSQIVERHRLRHEDFYSLASPRSDMRQLVLENQMSDGMIRQSADLLSIFLYGKSFNMFIGQSKNGRRSIRRK